VNPSSQSMARRGVVQIRDQTNDTVRDLFVPNGQNKKVKVSHYGRYFGDLQRNSSTEDQLRECRDVTDREGWDLAEEYLLSDEAKSGGSKAGFDGLEEPFRLAALKPCPFDGLIIVASPLELSYCFIPPDDLLFHL
jgi:hypothetical protein